jgi:hypothetical protein
MKAERRHELKTNALARFLEALPDLSRNYGGKALLFIVLLLLLVVFIRTRISANRQQVELSGQYLSSAWSDIERLRRPTRIEPVGLALVAPPARAGVGAGSREL